MKKLIAYFWVALLPLTLSAQNDTLKDILNRITGTRDAGKDYFQLGQYAIVTETVENDFSAKTRTKLKKKFGIKSNEKELIDNELNMEHFIVYKNEQYNGKINIYTATYFIRSNEKQVKTISFHANNYQDVLMEKALVKAYLNQLVPDSIFISRDVKDIDFMGRIIQVPSGVCQMMNLRGIQCPDFGQMNWALHRSLAEANNSINAQFEVSKTRKMVSLFADETVDVIFENKPIKARRIKLKVKLPKLVMGGSNTLIVYYVATEIRGFYVSCVLSHYDFDRLTANGLPVFLSEVMSLKIK
jgi:hypothetical protein